MAHGLRDWMLMHIFYRGLSETSKLFLDKECEGSFMNMSASNTYYLLDGLDRKSTRLNSSHSGESRMPSSA